VALAAIVVLFALVAPMAKTICLTLIHLSRLPARLLPALQVLSKLAMADVFLIAVYITLAKGLAVGRVETAWGLWLFTGLRAGLAGRGHRDRARSKGRQTMTLALTALAVFLLAYAALAALTWVRRLTGERPARRRAMGLNLARRAGPPALAGIAILVVALLAPAIPVAPGLS
jgi:hypothetical protein